MESSKKEEDTSTLEKKLEETTLEENKGEEEKVEAGKEEEEEEKEILPKHTNLEEKEEEKIVQLDLAGVPNKIDRQKTLLSAKTWDDKKLNLPQEIIDSALAMNFTKPSKIQAYAIPLILQDPPSHLIAQSRNGTGKTGAFGVGVLGRVDPSFNALQAIILANTRELSRQIYQFLIRIGKDLIEKKGLKIVLFKKGDRSPAAGQIVISTVGVVFGFVSRKKINLKCVKTFVLDEADSLFIEPNSADQTLQIFKAIPKGVQCLLFSATFPDKVRTFVMKTLESANQIALTTENLAVKEIYQMYIECGKDEKKDVLAKLYTVASITSTIIFVNTRVSAEQVFNYLKNAGHKVSLLMGGEMSVEERDRVIDDFREARVKVLITTNVLARGIDVPQVDLVVNYDLPLMADKKGFDFENYLHRIGRTGRFGQLGIALNMVCSDHDRKDIEGIEKFYNVSIKRIDRVESVKEMLMGIMKGNEREGTAEI